jgi:ubiquinol-cytochrome c reductase cytochrome b/c1 subunit
VTPTHIVPEWYYLPFYAILRAIPSKLGGVIALVAAIGIVALLPWLDTSRVRSARYRPLYRQFFWVFVLVCIGLGWLGSKPAEGGYVIWSRILTVYYFAHFLIILPILGLVETTTPLPTSISADVLKRKGIAATIVAILALAGLLVSNAPSQAAGEEDAPPKLNWSFAGPFGKFDRAQLQRGYWVYREVCQTCHGMQLLSFRNLAEAGGPGFSMAQVAAVAAEYKVQDGVDDAGKPIERPARPADRFPPAAVKFPGATPPDLSVIAKGRSYERGFPTFLLDIVTQYQEHGVDYITALLKGYADTPPAGVTLPPGAMYNKYFPGHAIAMPPPLSDNRVPYTDGFPKTVDQYSRDVAAFLMWAAEPHLEARKRLGLQVMIFLIVMAGLLYFTKKKVWHEVEKPAEIARGADPRATTV